MFLAQGHSNVPLASEPQNGDLLIPCLTLYHWPLRSSGMIYSIVVSRDGLNVRLIAQCVSSCTADRSGWGLLLIFCWLINQLMHDGELKPSFCLDIVVVFMSPAIIRKIRYRSLCKVSSLTKPHI